MWSRQKLRWVGLGQMKNGIKEFMACSPLHEGGEVEVEGRRGREYKGVREREGEWERERERGERERGKRDGKREEERGREREGERERDLNGEWE